MTFPAFSPALSVFRTPPGLFAPFFVAFKRKSEFFRKKYCFFGKVMVLYQSHHDTTEYGRLAQLVEHLLDVQEVTGSSPVPSTKTRASDLGQGLFITSSTNPRQSRTVQGENRAALTTPVGRVSNQPSGLLLSPRFPTARNVYQERCHQTIRSGDFFVAAAVSLVNPPCFRYNRTERRWAQ